MDDSHWEMLPAFQENVLHLAPSPATSYGRFTFRVTTGRGKTAIMEAADRGHEAENWRFTHRENESWDGWGWENGGLMGYEWDINGI